MICSGTVVEYMPVAVPDSIIARDSSGSSSHAMGSILAMSFLLSSDWTSADPTPVSESPSMSP